MDKKRTPPSEQPGDDALMDDFAARAPDVHPWLLVGVIEVSLFALAEDVCRISLERGEAADVLHLRYDEFGPARDVELPAAAGSDADAARAALAAASLRGHFGLLSVLTGGLLAAEECASIIQAGAAEWRSSYERAQDAATAAEASRPSRILAAARDAGLTPEPVGERSWVANCPGTGHTLMLGTSSETFGCGYCKAKGGPDELHAFVARMRAGRG